MLRIIAIAAIVAFGAWVWIFQVRDGRDIENDGMQTVAPTPGATAGCGFGLRWSGGSESAFLSVRIVRLPCAASSDSASLARRN